MTDGDLVIVPWRCDGCEKECSSSWRIRLFKAIHGPMRNYRVRDVCGSWSYICRKKCGTRQAMFCRTASVPKCCEHRSASPHSLSRLHARP